jgi:hypothetical protein
MSYFISSGGGTGSSAIDTVKVNQFKAGFTEAFQQTDVRLVDSFMMESQDSEYAYWDRIGLAEEMTEDTTRYGDNPQSEISFDRRRTQTRNYELGKYIDPKDLTRVLTDPTAPVISQMRYSGHRKMDDIVRDNIFGTAYAGKAGSTAISFVPTTSGKISVGELSKGASNPITTTSPTFGGYQLGGADTEGIDIALDYNPLGAAADSGITLEKLKAVRYTMMRLEAITQDEVLDVWLGAAQFEQLLGIDEVINSDYAIRKSLAEGNVTTFMGFRFRHFERLLGSGVTSDPRQCIIAKKQGLVFSQAKTLSLDIWRDTAKKNIPYIYFALQADAVRMQGECVARVNCLD